jgi:phytoene dehydrogenase-like protein
LQTYDAIIIGAGHNGLCTAAYLARAGLKVAIVERRHEEGGGANTEDPVVPGFRFNLHANYMEFFDIMPMIEDFDLENCGLRSITPENQAGIAFSDGRPPIVLHRKDMLDKTHASISRYSKSDADTYVELQKRTMDFGPLLGFGMYTPPFQGMVEGQAAMHADMYGDWGITVEDAAKTPKVMIDELFESPEMRTLMYRVSVEFGVGVDTAGYGGMVLSALPWMIGCWRIAKGGTHTLAKAMSQACYAHGVDLIENTEVEKIIVEDGRAVGVIARGKEMRATKCVITNADPKTTLLDQVGEEHLPDNWVRRAKNFRFGPSHVLATPMFCLYDAPDYKSARWDEDINRTHYTVVGYDTPEEAIRYIRDAYSGIIPEPAAGTWVNSLWDSSQAPAGRHSATGWYFFPGASELSAEEWTEVRATYNDRFLKRWEEFAPNMTRDNVIADKLYTPDQMERKNYMWEGDFSNGDMSLDQTYANRPWPEASNYRLGVDGLYLCGPSAYPGGGMHAAAGYNAYKVIAEDLDLPSPITERGY